MRTEPEPLQFLDEDQIRQLVQVHGTPLFVYSKSVLRDQAQKTLDLVMDQPFGGSVRYAMKANRHPQLLKLLTELGIKIDASSGYEADYAIQSDVPPSNILLTAQEFPKNLPDLVESGVEFTATSLHQLKTYCELFPGRDVSVRVNPGIGSGYNQRLTTGGPESSFGIWYEYTDDIKQIAGESGCNIIRVHTHIGTGTDPAQWQAALDMTLEIVKDFPQAQIVDIGGGFKVAYMLEEHDADMGRISEVIREALLDFEKLTGRQLQLEIEPGRFLVAKCGTLLAEIIDQTDTGANGYNFLRLNTGMNDILRPAMYGSQHPLVVIPANVDLSPSDNEEYVVVGHNCESSDLLTTSPGNPELASPRQLRRAEIGDYMAIEMAGAYCASMSAKLYNSFVDAKEAIID